MIELFRGYLDQGEWKTKKDCIDWYKSNYRAKLDERVFRLWVEKFNERYCGGETEMFVAHSRKGYMLTSDKDRIRKSLEDDYKRAIKLLTRHYRCIKALSEKNQLSLLPKEIDAYEIISKLYES